MNANEIIKKYNELKGTRSNFESYWQILHDYFYVEAANINKSYYPGTELDFSYLWDSTTLESADVLAAGFMNYLTPPTSKWFGLRHKEPSLSGDKTVNTWLDDVAREVYHALNKSNFYQQLISGYKSSGVYGTAIVLEEEDIEDDIRFYNLPLKSVLIVEDARGRIVEYYIEFEYTAYQAVSRWGVEAVSEEIKEESSRRSDKKFKFLLYIGKRSVRDVDKSDKFNMPIQALWVDYGKKTIVDEGGYHEFPIMAHRFDKRPFIPWGFSPAMKALPFARLLNASAKTNIRSMMKQTDPPIAIPHGAFLMPLNFNPRGVNYYKRKEIMDASKSVFPLGAYGNVDVGLAAVEYYAQKVRRIMYNDVFLAFQAIDKQMNNPEVYERINEKMAMLGPAVGRFTGEVLNPIIIRTINILYRRGRLPKVPDVLLFNPEYEIDYVSALAQAQKRSQLNSLLTALQVVGEMANYSPQVLDKVDTDKAVSETWDILSAPAGILRDDREVEAIRENRAKMQEELARREAMEQAARTVKTGAEAEKALAEARNAPSSKGVME